MALPDLLAALIAARTVQGVATAVLLSTLSAAAVDLEPEERPGAATTWNAVIPLIGLALGALAAGLLLDHVAAPALFVFGSLAAIFVIVAILVWTIPETAPKHSGLLASLRPTVDLTPAVRGPFLRAAPAMAAGWATGGLFLSLGPTIV
ncbi:MAG: MFS transporter, partial [Proteobacteria bacterium]|nr:MFS transporter [Pseudomonadota bacterium]